MKEITNPTTSKVNKSNDALPTHIDDNKKMVHDDNIKKMIHDDNIKKMINDVNNKKMIHDVKSLVNSFTVEDISKKTISHIRFHITPNNPEDNCIIIQYGGEKSMLDALGDQ